MNTITYIQVLGGCGTPYPHVKVYHTIGMWWWKQRCVSILYKKKHTGIIHLTTVDYII